MPSRVTRFHRYQCEWEPCNKSFQRKSDMQRHYRIHTNERPFTCHYGACSKSFIQRSALTVHLRTHTGEKPHQCKYPGCEKRFSDSSSLARHRRIHTSKRPHDCGHESCTRRHRRRVHKLGQIRSQLDESSSESGMELSPTPNPSPATLCDSIPRSTSYATLDQCMDAYSPPEYHTEATPMPEQRRFIPGYDEPSDAQTPYYVPEQVTRGVTTLDLSGIPQFQTRPPPPPSPLPSLNGPLSPGYSTPGYSSPSYSSPAFSPAATVPSQSGYFDPDHHSSPSLEQQQQQHALIQFPSVPQQLYPTSDVRGHFHQPPPQQWQANGLPFQQQQRMCVPLVSQVPVYSAVGFNYWDVEAADELMLMQGARYANSECSSVVF